MNVNECVKRKTLQVYTGTEVYFSNPSHPYTGALSAINIIDRILKLPETEFEIKTNCEALIKVLNLYGPKNYIIVQFYTNGVLVSYESVMADFGRAKSIIDSITKKK